MAANPDRRALLTDAALTLLGSAGPRGLTHRAVDRAAGVPVGSAANYFPSRGDLFLAMAERIFVRLAREQEQLAQLAAAPAADAEEEYAAYVTERLLEHRDLAAALIELRLEAARAEDVRATLAPFLRDGFAEDLRFHHERGLPGGRSEVLRLHHLINGVVLDAVTLPLDPERSPVQEVRAAVRALHGAGAHGG